MATQLNKFIAQAGICSRRKAEELIKNGTITVNGETITDSGYRVKSEDIVIYKNEILKPEKKIYILLNKPKGYITTTSDERNRKTVMDLFGDYCKERLYPVGRLDRATTGVLLITNDGELAQQLAHPKNKVPKVYNVELDKRLTRNDATQIQQGVKLSDGFIKVDNLFVTENPKFSTVQLHSGKNHIVRRIFEHFGYKIVKLDRIFYAGLTKKSLDRGQWRVLTQSEIKKLYSLSFD